MPWGSKQRIGVVMQKLDESSYDIDKLKAVTTAYTEEPPLSDAILKLLHFSAQYYQYPTGQAVLAALPGKLKQVKPTQSRLPQAYQLSEKGKGIALSDIPKRQRVKQQLLTALQQKEWLSDQDIQAISSSAKRVINHWLDEGLVEQHSVTEMQVNTPAGTAPNLNAEQAAALQALTQTTDQFMAWLIHGITGSGKTEVYMQAIAHFIANKEAAPVQVLVLVPEINLTPQLEQRFLSRFPAQTLVSLHSHLNDSERLHHWQLAQTGKANIIIGTRLSVFTPIPHLKLIIIDEEHDSSYKQQDSMRYHARDVALLRAKQANIPVILGSATPALESWHNAKQGKYQLLSMTERAVTQAQLPSIQCIDTSKLNLNNGFSPQLIKALKSRLARGEQSLLFINRRGYAPVLLCHQCQWVATCPRCSSRLVVHKHLNRLNCHHCGHEAFIPESCPKCHAQDCHPVGHATQRIEETLRQLFPEARIARVDRDTMRRKDALTELLTAVHDNKIDILVGTQMLAKGHDFPNLTLVGILDTDSALHSPDFRASERLFAQLMQVAGRAGRAEKPGEVLIQTEFPNHTLFNALRRQDYPAFADELLTERALMQFPPYAFTALLRAEANQYPLIERVLSHANDYCQARTTSITIYGPVRPQIERLKGMERAQLIFQTTHRTALQRLLQDLFTHLSEYAPAKKVRWCIDVDPIAF